MRIAVDRLHILTKLIALSSFSVLLLSDNWTVVIVAVAYYAFLAKLAESNIFRDNKGLIVFLFILFFISLVLNIQIAQEPFGDALTHAIAIVVKWSFSILSALLIAKSVGAHEFVWLTSFIHPKASIPFIAAFRTFPKLIEDSEKIRIALSARGSTFRNRPIRSLVRLFAHYLFAFTSGLIFFLSDLWLAFRMKGSMSRRSTLLICPRFGMLDIPVLFGAVALLTAYFLDVFDLILPIEKVIPLLIAMTIELMDETKIGQINYSVDFALVALLIAEIGWMLPSLGNFWQELVEHCDETLRIYRYEEATHRESIFGIKEFFKFYHILPMLIALHAYISCLVVISYVFLVLPFTIKNYILFPSESNYSVILGLWRLFTIAVDVFLPFIVVSWAVYILRRTEPMIHRINSIKHKYNIRTMRDDK